VRIFYRNLVGPIGNLTLSAVAGIVINGGGSGSTAPTQGTNGSALAIKLV
jgi:hypothetical protein